MRKTLLGSKNMQAATRSNSDVFLRFAGTENFQSARSWKSHRKKPQEVENLTARSHKNLWILPQTF